MKRKGGNKKGKSKKPKLVGTNEVASNVVSLNTEDKSPLDEFDNDEIDSGTDTKTTPSSEPEKTIDPDSIRRPLDNSFVKAVYTRVKVKIKNSKPLDSQHTSSNAPIQSDTDKNKHQLGSEKPEIINEKTEDSANSLSETNGEASGITSKKSVGIKIKSSRGFASSMSPCSNIEPVKGEKKDAELVNQEVVYNEKELKAALEVIRKIMKMDAAEPFNVPVNPVALGIPDYFDVIDTPMDFGTICNNLENGVKYMNSEDVFKDVQYVWNNCYKYNNKGDYIVELMKRVKKNFMKYWTAAGLFNDQPQETDGVESNPVNDVTPPNQGDTPDDSGALSVSASKFHGLKKHKEGCQCAICVMMRRRQEREEITRLMGGQTEGSEDSLGEEMKQEEASHGESHFGEYENSPDAMKLGHIRNLYGHQKDIDFTRSQDLQSMNRPGDENNRIYKAPHVIGPGGSVSAKEMPMRNGDGSAAAIDQQNPKEPLDKNQRAKMLENLRYLENPMLLELYGTLFSDNSKSFWNGPHSLVKRQGGSTSNRRSSIHSAISTFMK